MPRLHKVVSAALDADERIAAAQEEQAKARAERKSYIKQMDDDQREKYRSQFARRFA